MRKPLRYIISGLLAGLLMTVLGGCGMFKPVENLYALPALPEGYSQLQTEIQTVMDEMSAEYAAISYGSNTSTIQLLDMDGDGKQEYAAVFLRANSAEEKPLRVCLFHRDNKDVYKRIGTIAGDGLSIHSVVYEDLTGDGIREMIVSWQMSVKVQTLSVYQVSREGTDELMSTSYNERFLTVDLNKDDSKEIVVLQRGSSETDSNRAELYRNQGGVMLMASSTKLSACVKSITAATLGVLSDGVPGIYVTGEGDEGVVTDVLTLSEGNLVNLTLDPEQGISPNLRSYTEVGPADINRDGVIEIPIPTPAANLEREEEPKYYFVYWQQYDSEGNATLISNEATYHSVVDGWYFTMPRSWVGKITVERDDSRSIRGERSVVFYYWPDPETTSPAPFLTIYRLTGDNRFSRAKLSGRVSLYRDTSAIYCATLNPEVWQCGLEENDLAARFRLITAEWSAQ